MPFAVRSDARSSYREVHYIHLLSSIDVVSPFPVAHKYSETFNPFDGDLCRVGLGESTRIVSTVTDVDEEK